MPLDFKKRKKPDSRGADEKLRALVKELEDIKFILDRYAIVAVTDGEGKFIHVNDRFCKISKFTRRELIGQDHGTVNAQHHPESFIRNLWQTVRRGKVWHGEMCHRAKDGSLFWMDTIVIPFLDPSQSPYQYIFICHDISVRKEMEKAVQALPQRIIQAQEEDHKKMSREIHDDLGQSLATLKMLIQAHQADVTRRHGCRPMGSYQKIITYLDTIIDKTRSLAAGLQPSILEVLGPTAALKALINEFRYKKGMRIHFSCVPLEQFAFQAEVINLYRIIQEALTNIVRHAGATHIDIRLRKFKNSLRIHVQDNGCGLYKDDKPNGSPAGLGFSTMRERARLLGGNLEVMSSPKGGTSLAVEIPIRLR